MRPCSKSLGVEIKAISLKTIQKAASHKKPITYKSLARTENSLQVLEKFAIFDNVQPHLQATPPLDKGEGVTHVLPRHASASAVCRSTFQPSFVRCAVRRGFAG